MGQIGIDRAESIVQIASDCGVGPNDQQYPTIGPLWDAFAAKDAVYPWLRYWYTERAVIDTLLGDPSSRDATTWSQGGASETGDQIFQHRKALWDKANTEIMRLESYANHSHAPVQGQMVTTRPGCPPDGYHPNPASGYYRGDPQSWRPQW